MNKDIIEKIADSLDCSIINFESEQVKKFSILLDKKIFIFEDDILKLVLKRSFEHNNKTYKTIEFRCPMATEITKIKDFSNSNILELAFLYTTLPKGAGHLINIQVLSQISTAIGAFF